MSSRFAAWPEDRIHFEREFKPALAKLIRLHFPGWRLKDVQLLETRPGLMTDELRFGMTVIDGLSRLELVSIDTETK